MPAEPDPKPASLAPSNVESIVGVIERLTDGHSS